MAVRWLRAAAFAAALVVIGVAISRHLRDGGGRPVAGGILISDASAYDRISRLLFGSFFRPIAADVSALVEPGARVLEVGCGPGHLAIRLAADHRLSVVGLDLDPAMIERALTNARRSGVDPEPEFVVADVAALPFADASFDLVVSTLSMHHWDDPAAGLAEIARVLVPGGRALIWDLGSSAPLHHHVPDPTEHLDDSTLRQASMTPWRWPWRFSFSQRIELVRDAVS
jgi:ubiquinone/menaquinone biosynthesis C-methylase UbiE